MTGSANGQGRDPDRAARRFALIQLTRLGGVALVITSLLALRDRIELPQALAWPMLALGFACVFIVPQWLARKWRSNR